MPLDANLPHWRATALRRAEGLNSRRPGRRSLRKTVIWGFGAIVLLLAGGVLYYWNDVRLARADTVDLVQQAFERYGHGVTAGDFAPARIETLLAIEDPAFRRHNGVDLETPGAGMTTISQALIKLLYFPDGFKPGIRKIRQTLVAQYAFDPLVGKDEQLDLYLNATYFGSVDGAPVNGIDDAARTYFDKSHRDLSEGEFIALIGMTIFPNTLKPGTAASAERVERIKRYLSNEVEPGSVLDVEYVGKTSGTFLEEALMSFLRLVTDADPGSKGPLSKS